MDEDPTEIRRRAQERRARSQAQKAATRFDDERGDHLESLSMLAESFHALSVDVPGIRPWDAESLARWVRDGDASHTTKLAAIFVLNVWRKSDGSEAFSWPPFDAMQALAHWDRSHIAAFVGWAENPWVP